jgi:integrase
MSRSTNFRKVSGAKGIYQNKSTHKYFVEKRIKGKLYSESFLSLFEAKQWQKKFDGTAIQDDSIEGDFSNLKDVWESMQRNHFPILATSTKDIWIRRYKLLETIEHLPMNKITPSKITDWVIYWVSHFSTEEYQSGGRGKAGRCNLNNELNLFVSIFNWYKQSELFEKEALALTCPVKLKHRKMGFIKTLPDKRKQIQLADAFLFFDFLRPLYQDLAKMQFFTAGRIGEVAGIQWANVDIKNRRLLIKKHVYCIIKTKFL